MELKIKSIERRFIHMEASSCMRVYTNKTVGSHDFFELIAAKRGKRLHWTNEAGERGFSNKLSIARFEGFIPLEIMYIHIIVSF